MQIDQDAHLRESCGLFARAAALAGLMTMLVANPTSAASPILERIRESGHIRMGYYADANPFSFSAGLSRADGYGIELCNRIAMGIQNQLKLDLLTIDLVSVPFDPRFRGVADGAVDLLCTPVSETLERRKDVSFSIPVFPGGIRAIVNIDAPSALREALSEAPASRVVWRGSPASKVLDKATFAVVKGTATERLLSRRLATFQVGAKLLVLPDYRTGLQQLIEKKIDVFFGDRALILGAMNSETRRGVTAIERRLTHEPFALALQRDDEDFRLTVDAALSNLYRSAEFRSLYLKWFDEFSDSTRTFFQWSAVEQ